MSIQVLNELRLDVINQALPHCRVFICRGEGDGGYPFSFFADLTKTLRDRVYTMIDAYDVVTLRSEKDDITSGLYCVIGTLRKRDYMVEANFKDIAALKGLLSRQIEPWSKKHAAMTWAVCLGIVAAILYISVGNAYHDPQNALNIFAEIFVLLAAIFVGFVMPSVVLPKMYEARRQRLIDALIDHESIGSPIAPIISNRKLKTF